ncbi:hypothetical protein H6G00_01575 [Leptolyngbya sp. FACHB-541]|uniref:hypothetical protein n=1 Tax=Leptolyngbya sp. FACHB-541 TaxID=2692810 RepID=UPI001685A545|nr:hypothetical protein [Leptolyngbya sp. FACHB-541]MBD1995320.1 hypothetical protein [Leptolyngbya sp. FACHB-541]
MSESAEKVLTVAFEGYEIRVFGGKKGHVSSEVWLNDELQAELPNRLDSQKAISAARRFIREKVGKSPSKKRIDKRVLELLMGSPGKELTVSGIATALNTSHGNVSLTCRILRQNGEIRFEQRKNLKGEPIVYWWEPPHGAIAMNQNSNHVFDFETVSGTAYLIVPRKLTAEDREHLKELIPEALDTPIPQTPAELSKQIEHTRESFNAKHRGDRQSAGRD